jgi:hypothetical protein
VKSLYTPYIFLSIKDKLHLIRSHQYFTCANLIFQVLVKQGRIRYTGIGFVKFEGEQSEPKVDEGAA